MKRFGIILLYFFIVYPVVFTVVSPFVASVLSEDGAAYLIIQFVLPIIITIAIYKFFNKKPSKSYKDIKEGSLALIDGNKDYIQLYDSNNKKHKTFKGYKYNIFLSTENNLLKSWLSDYEKYKS